MRKSWVFGTWETSIDNASPRFTFYIKDSLINQLKARVRGLKSTIKYCQPGLSTRRKTRSSFKSKFHCSVFSTHSVSLVPTESDRAIYYFHTLPNYLDCLQTGPFQHHNEPTASALASCPEPGPLRRRVIPVLFLPCKTPFTRLQATAGRSHLASRPEVALTSSNSQLRVRPHGQLPP